MLQDFKDFSFTELDIEKAEKVVRNYPVTAGRPVEASGSFRKASGNYLKVAV